MRGQQERTDGNLTKAGYCMVPEQKVSAPHAGSCLLAGSYWKSPITHLEQGPSSSNMVQAVDKKGPAKAARPVWSSHTAAQGGSSCRAWEHEGSQEHPSLLMALTRSRDTTEQPLPDPAAHQTVPVSEHISYLHPTFPATGSCLAPAMALDWHFFHYPVPHTKPAENSPRKKPHSGSDWALQRPGEHQHGHMEGLLHTKWGAGRTEQEATCFDSSLLRMVQPSHVIAFLCSIAWRFTLPVPACVNSAPVLADRGWLNWDKDFFFFKELQKDFFFLCFRSHKNTQKDKAINAHMHFLVFISILWNEARDI